MKTFAKGDKVQITASFHDECVGKTTTVTRGTSGSTTCVEDPCGEYEDHLYISSEKLRLIRNSLDELRTGDILLDDDGDEREVYAVAGNLVAVDDGDADDRCFDWKHIEDLKRGGFTLKQDTPAEITELTLEDIAKLKGVDVSQIKIVEK